jgi:hypothetical protein
MSKLDTVAQFRIPIPFLRANVLLCNNRPKGPWDDCLDELPSSQHYHRGGKAIPSSGKVYFNGPLPRFRYVVVRLQSGFIVTAMAANSGSSLLVERGSEYMIDFTME